jgi:hypothetical protein
MMVMDRYRLQPDKWDNRIIVRAAGALVLALCVEID